MDEQRKELISKLYSEETFRGITRRIFQGADLQTAVVAAGINYRSFLRIMERGYEEYLREGEGKKVRVAGAPSHAVYSEIQKAVSLSISSTLSNIKDHDDWKAQKWILEKQSPLYEPISFAPVRLNPSGEGDDTDY